MTLTKTQARRERKKRQKASAAALASTNSENLEGEEGQAATTSEAPLGNKELSMEKGGSNSNSNSNGSREGDNIIGGISFNSTANSTSSTCLNSNSQSQEGPQRILMDPAELEGVGGGGVKVLWTSKQDFQGRKDDLVKYWFQRYSLFSRFDDPRGIWLDETGWFSVTPESISMHLAERFKKAGCTTVLDPFAGVGGNVIAFARLGMRCIGVEVDKTRLECIRHNAEVYSVSHLVTLIHGNFMTLAPSIAKAHPSIDGIFLSPPWGGISYLSQTSSPYFDINNMPINGTEIFTTCFTNFTKNICYYLPKNINHGQLIGLAGLFEESGEERGLEIEEEGGGSGVRVVSQTASTITASGEVKKKLVVELQQTFVDDRLKCWSIFYGILAGALD